MSTTARLVGLFTLFLACLALRPLAAHAQPSVACSNRRSDCEAAIFAQCPQGATIVNEQLLRPPQVTSPAQVQYRLQYRCGQHDYPRNAASHQAWIRERRAARASYRLAGPITLTIVGALGASAVLWRAVQDDGDNVAALTLGGLLSAAFLVPGTVWLARSVRKRRAISRELQQYAAGLSPAVAFSTKSLSAGVRLSF